MEDTDTTKSRSGLSLDNIAEYIRRAGLVAYVEQTGGGVATIYASREADPATGFPKSSWSELDGMDMHDLAIGPGWFNGPDWSDGRVSLAECYVGPDGDPFPLKPWEAGPDDTESSIAAEAIAQLRGPATPERLAFEFVNVLRHWLTIDDIVAIRKLNKAEPSPDVCHSHDVCDANAAMVQALVNLGALADTRQMPTDTELWNAAWNIATTRYLTEDETWNR